MIVYLVAVRPYIEWQLQWLELICHVLEAVIIGCAMALVSETVLPLDWVMVGEYLMHVISNSVMVILFLFFCAV